MSGESAELEFEVIGLDGKRRWLRTQACPIARSHRCYYVGSRYQPRHHRPARARSPGAAIAEDGSDRPARRRHRARLQQHPDRHPGLRTDAARGRTGSRRPRNTATRHIVQAVERAAGLTRQLLAFGRRQVMQPQHVDLNEPRHQPRHDGAAACLAKRSICNCSCRPAAPADPRRCRIDRSGPDEPGHQCA